MADDNEPEADPPLDEIIEEEGAEPPMKKARKAQNRQGRKQDRTGRKQDRTGRKQIRDREKDNVRQRKAREAVDNALQKYVTARDNETLYELTQEEQNVSMAALAKKSKAALHQKESRAKARIASAIHAQDEQNVAVHALELKSKAALHMREIRDKARATETSKNSCEVSNKRKLAELICDNDNDECEWFYLFTPREDLPTTS